LAFAVSACVLFEALLCAGFFALAIPFGFLSRRVKQSKLSAVKKWPLFLGIVHTPVLPLIAFVKVFEVTIEFELLLVAVLLSGHTAGVLLHRRLVPKAAPAAVPASP
jgi:hypothetical protein